MQKNAAPTAILIYTGFGPLIALSYFWLIDAICRAKASHADEISYEAMKKSQKKKSFGDHPAYTIKLFYPGIFFVPYIGLAACTAINFIGPLPG